MVLTPPNSIRRPPHQYPFVFETHETTIHVAAVPVLIGYVRVSKADGSQVLD